MKRADAIFASAPRPSRCVAGWRACALVSMLVLFGSACADDDGDGTHGSVHGTVRDAMSGKRLAGVAVEFVADTLEQADDTTDGEGKYAIEVVAATPTGRLTASKSGYETRVVSVFFDDGEVAVDIELAALSSSAR